MTSTEFAMLSNAALLSAFARATPDHHDLLDDARTDARLPRASRQGEDDVRVALHVGPDRDGGITLRGVADGWLVVAHGGAQGGLFAEGDMLGRVLARETVLVELRAFGWRLGRAVLGEVVAAEALVAETLAAAA